MNTNEFRRYLASIHNVLNSNQRHLYESNEEEVEVEEVEESGDDAKEVVESLVMEFLESYFGEELNENTSDEDITEAIINLNRTCGAVNAYFGVNNEGVGGAALGAVGGGLVAGPLGAVVGGIAGHKIQKGLKKAGNPKPNA